jgi:hypothetical protein
MTMSAMASPASPTAPATPELRPAPASDWRIQAAIVFGFQMAFFLFHALRTDHALIFADSYDYVFYKVDEFARQFTNIVTTVAALQWIGRRNLRHRHRKLISILAMVSAGLTSTALATFMFPYEPIAVSVGASASTSIWFWFTLWNHTVIALLSLLVVDTLYRRQQAMNQLAAAQERGRVVRQELASAQLLAIQARVDPQLLFDMLAAVKRFYEQDVARAEALLGDLTAFLRVALSQLRSAHSTLELEFGLVQSYVSLVRGAGAGSVEFEMGLPKELAMATFPAGILLPLLVDAKVHERCIRLDASAQKTTLRIRVVDSSAPAAGTLERLRDSLAAFYGERGLLRTRLLSMGAETVLEVPLAFR